VRGMVPAVIGLLLLSGCGTYRWEKAGAGPDDFRRDDATCERQAPSGQWEACMEGLGWRYAGRAMW
jgi:hypothetical protein